MSGRERKKGERGDDDDDKGKRNGAVRLLSAATDRGNARGARLVTRRKE